MACQPPRTDLPRPRRVPWCLRPQTLLFLYSNPTISIVRFVSRHNRQIFWGGFSRVYIVSICDGTLGFYVLCGRLLCCCGLNVLGSVVATALGCARCHGPRMVRYWWKGLSSTRVRCINSDSNPDLGSSGQWECDHVSA